MNSRCPSVLLRLAIVTMMLALLLCGNSLVPVAVSADLATQANDLPPDGIYPQGRKLAFAGYSGDPARDLANGFTLAGPVYGNQQPYLERCFANDWPVIAHIGPSITFNDQAPNKYKLDPASLRQEVERQVKELAVHKQIAWWAVRPEELRPWRTAEMQYLAIVCDTIRENDPLGRPIYLYNPNHRTASSLLPIAKHVDILAKGCYVNLVGRKRDRAWVRWSVEQTIKALEAAGRTDAIGLVMPELCRDPEPDEDDEIRAWVRHDVYLGLASGAKGVLIWSLFKRPAVRRTWQLWYDAYSECGRELNGELGLSQVFLFGERATTLRVQPTSVPAAGTITIGGDAEATTTSQQEREQREIELPSWTAAEFVYDGNHWLWLVNSANTGATFRLSGWPNEPRVCDAFTGKAIDVETGSPHELALPAYGVAAIRWTERAGQPSLDEQSRARGSQGDLPSLRTRRASSKQQLDSQPLPQNNEHGGIGISRRVNPAA
jgi:hypothetical protein